MTLTLLKDGKPLFTEQGEALFTHFGISGPLVLSASTYIDDVQLHRYIAEFDLKPALNEKTLYDRLTRDFAALGGHSAQGLSLIHISLIAFTAGVWYNLFCINLQSRALLCGKNQQQKGCLLYTSRCV